jgi:hypothetical protein
LLLLSFCFAKKERSKEKGDFGPKAPPAQKGSTLVSHRAYQRHGAGFSPMPNSIGLLVVVLNISFLIWLHQSYLRTKKAPSKLVVIAPIGMQIVSGFLVFGLRVPEVLIIKLKLILTTMQGYCVSVKPITFIL